MTRPSDLPLEIIECLTTKHIDRYERMVRAGRRGDRSIRTDECVQLLTIWRSVKAKGHVWDKLEQAERTEIRDAWEDEQ